MTLETRRSRRRDKLTRASVDSINAELQKLYKPQELDQSPIPSQSPSDIQTYSHDAFQGDIESAEETTPDQNLLRGAPISRPFVLSTFDARPINAIDVISTFTAAEQAALAASAVANFSFTVPAGYVALFRELRFRAWFNLVGATPVFDATTGAPNVQMTMTWLNNGSAYLGLSGVRVDGNVADKTLNLEDPLQLYFLANDEETVTLQLTILNPAAFTFAKVQPYIRINLLLADGVNPSSEPGTKRPIPIVDFATLGRMVQNG